MAGKPELSVYVNDHSRIQDQIIKNASSIADQ